MHVQVTVVSAKCQSISCPLEAGTLGTLVLGRSLARDTESWAGSGRPPLLAAGPVAGLAAAPADDCLQVAPPGSGHSATLPVKAVAR